MNGNDIKRNVIKEETNKNVLKNILKMFMITRIILVIFLIFSEIFLSNYDISVYKHVFDLFDNKHYLNIADNGYTHMYELAFFPLTPLLIRYFGKIGFLFLNQLCVFFSGYLFYLISKHIFEKENNYWVTLLYFISPISVFTCMFYSEALFIFLTLLAFYLYKNTKKYFSLGIVLGLSVLTRSLGSMEFFTIFIFMFFNFIKNNEKLKNILITFATATIISCLYPIYLYIKTGDFLYFMTVQYEYWERVSTNIFIIFFDVFRLTFKTPAFIHILDFFVVFGLIIYIFYFIFKHRNEKKYYEIFLYIFFSILVICSTIRNSATAISSFYRYLFGCFPIYFMFKKNYLTFSLFLLYTFFISIVFLLGIHFY